MPNKIQMKPLEVTLLNQKNKEFHEWSNRQNSFFQLLELAKLLPHEYTDDTDFNVDQCRLSILRGPNGGPYLHFRCGPGLDNTYWGWALNYGDDELCRGNLEKVFAYFSAFMKAKELFSNAD